MTRSVEAATLKTWLHDGQEIALFDVREHGQYGQSHLFYAIPLPYSRLELDVLRLAPRHSVRLVVYDDDGQSAAPAAARRLAALGYTNVHVLQGGTGGWQAAGFALFAGVNVPSKTFGELAEQVYHTPRVSATELASLLADKKDVVVLDGRPFSEFQKMNIPTAISCPNGELGLRIRDLVPSEETHIVVNCAGRTRSIIGAQTLINLGLRNPVSALENGTQGWYLADLPLEHGGTRRYPERKEPQAPATQAGMRAAAEALATRFKVPMVSAKTVRDWAADAQRTLFLCDVRSPEEYARGSLPGAQHTPGGQLMQANDQYVGVRHARLVLFDSDGIRARTVASWLRQMGHDASVLEEGLASGLALLAMQAAALPALPTISAKVLAARLASGTVLAIDLRPSMQFRQAHMAGTQWAIRPRLAAALAGATQPLVLIADEAGVAACAAIDLQELGLSVSLLEGGMAAWRAAGLPLQDKGDTPADSDCIDYLFFVHDRHDGNKEAARQYLAWEVNLIGQLDALELNAFRLPAAGAGAGARAEHATAQA
ncbi:rhodanese-like domain-containing protein [Polaromonas jejuensis]|uniref:Rhodanese-like domain-containing protein n=1 Tax=Polaromonas jejuensis TaxID=457502 RepID=A0ABW0QGZ1_9BURK|nr:rhodanese-like domain-containing protein [Polaromonas jejuensis]